MSIEQIRQEGVQIKNQVAAITDPEELRKLFESKKDDSRFRFHLARNKKTPLDVMQALTEQYPSDLHMLAELKLNEGATDEIIEAISKITTELNNDAWGGYMKDRLQGK